MVTVLRHRNFALLWVAGLVSVLGDWVLFVALPFFVYQFTGSALATGGMFAAQTIPRVIFGSIAGIFVDRWNRKYTMVAADLMRCGLLLLLLLVHSRTTLWLVYFVAVVESSIAQLFSPAKNALLPSMVGSQDLVIANGLNALGDNLARIVGPTLGGGLLTLFGLASGAIIDSLSFFISGILIALIAASSVRLEHITEKSDAQISPWKKVWQEWWEGLHLIGKDRLIRTIFVTIGIVMLAEGIILVLLVPFVAVVMHGTSSTLGWLMTALGIGGFLGGLVINFMSKLASPLRLIAMTAFIGGILRLAVVMFPIFFLALLLQALAGIIAIALYVNVSALLQSLVENRYLGRVFGVFGTIQALMMLCGMGIASTLGDHVGIVPVMACACCLYALAGIVMRLCSQ